MKPLIVFSHGFGVRFDDRGLLTDIAQAFIDIESVLFDYNDVDETKNILTAKSLSEQAVLLEQIIDQSRQPGQEVTLICHSQGCIVAALSRSKDVKRVIFLAPPCDSSREKIEALFEGRAGSTLNKQGLSVLQRRDGSTTHIPKEYWQSLDGLDVMNLYQQLANNTELTIVRATKDEILGKTDFSKLHGAVIKDLPANHDFTGTMRAGLMKLLHEVLG